MEWRTLHLLFVLWFYFLCETSLVSNCCRDEERQALFSFKHSLNDTYHVLSDWKGGECCRWAGVGCSNKTDHVVKLSIGSLIRNGEFSYYFPISTSHLDHSLSALKHLQYLDLSNTFFNYTSIPQYIGSFTSLRHLKLSSCDFAGAIPHHLGNLTNLQYLDLSYNFLNGSFPESLGQLSGLKNLDLSFNSLNGSVPESLGQLSGLEYLDLSNNFFKGFIPGILENLCNLQTLYLRNNEIVGDLSGMVVGPQGCRRYSLETLDLSSNQLSGSLPDWIGQMRNLKSLLLNNNILNGSVAESLGQLSELETLDLSENSLQGVVSDAHFTKMTKLDVLVLYPKRLVFNISSTWVPPFQLKAIELGSCRLGPQFPSWLRTQRKLSHIDISNAGISNVVPDWFWNVSSGVSYLNISHNQISGEVPTSLNFPSALAIDMRSNLLQGHLPYLNSSVRYLVLSDNLFSGDLQSIFNETRSELITVILSRNLLTGRIPWAICKMKYADILDLSYNNLSGKIPKCRSDPYSYSWSVINLAGNDLWGSIPRWMGSPPRLQLLSLSKNSFHGEIPSLRNCTGMIILDLGENKLTGNIPTWFGESLSSLRFLRLRSNMLNGTIPQTLSYLTSLQVLDLAHNHLSGTIPCSFKNFTGMAKPNKTVEDFFHYKCSYYDFRLYTYEETFVVVTKGRELEYTKTISLVMLLDLSCNNLSGQIPVELMNLVGLQSLNLSENQLMGKIPDKIGDMVRLETLDLSRNQLSGAIPWSITSLDALNHLNLSYNNLSGRIPSGNQLQTLIDPSIYGGNRNLCGFPLPKACPGDESSKVPKAVGGEENDDGSDMFGLYLSMGLGYVVGLWGVCGVLLFKNSWRIAYFQFFDDMTNKISVAKESLKRMMVCASRPRKETPSL